MPTGAWSVGSVRDPHLLEFLQLVRSFAQMISGARCPRQSIRRPSDMLRPAEVKPFVGIGSKRDHLLSLRREPHVGIDDRKRALLVHLLKKARRHNVDTRKSESMPGQSGGLGGFLRT